MIDSATVILAAVAFVVAQAKDLGSIYNQRVTSVQKMSGIPAWVTKQDGVM